jgi:pimeloyl-ACP methyl ester carboxylesterase
MSKLSKWKRRLARLAIVCLAILAFGTIYEAYAVRRDTARYPPPGQVAEIRGRKIHLNCTGHGHPTVVLESAFAGPALLWLPLQTEIESVTRVCSYDRDGLGWSADSGQPRTAAAFSSDLHASLAAVGESGPFVLVGHSLGGMLVLNYARQYPAEVAGVVLLDSTHPGQFAPGSEQWKDHQTVLKFMPYLTTAAYMGWLRAALWIGDRLKPLPLAEPSRKQYISLASSPKAAGALKAEAQALYQLCADSLPLPNLGSKPLLVVSAERTAIEEPAMVGLHEEMARLSSVGERVVVKDASHSGLVLKAKPVQDCARLIKALIMRLRQNAN